VTKNKGKEEKIILLKKETYKLRDSEGENI